MLASVDGQMELVSLMARQTDCYLDSIYLFKTQIAARLLEVLREAEEVIAKENLCSFDAGRDRLARCARRAFSSVSQLFS